MTGDGDSGGVPSSVPPFGLSLLERLDSSFSFLLSFSLSLSLFPPPRICQCGKAMLDGFEIG